MVAAVNFYLNQWLQVELPNDCATLCSKVDPQHNNTCQTMCDLYGVYEFIQLLSEYDIDVIYLCQLKKQCPVLACKDKTCAHITQITLSPTHPKSGDMLTVTGYYTVTGAAGAGMLRLYSQMARTCPSSLVFTFAISSLLHFVHKYIDFTTFSNTMSR